MKTVQMTLDEQLVKAVDSAARKLGTTRSGLPGKPYVPRSRKFASKNWSCNTAKDTNVSQLGAASLASGNRNRSGAIDEARGS